MIETPDALRHVRHFVDGVCPVCNKAGRVQTCTNCHLVSCGPEMMRVAVAADDEPCPVWTTFDEPCSNAG